MSEQASLESACGSIGSTAPGAYTLVERLRASRSSGEPSGTCAATSAMCTQIRIPPASAPAPPSTPAPRSLPPPWPPPAAPASIGSAEMASSKSRALIGSIVNVGSSRRSRRSPGARLTRSPAARASLSSAGSKPRARPRSSSSPSITSRATSGRPSTRTTRTPAPRPREEPCTSTRSPAETSSLPPRPERAGPSVRRAAPRLCGCPWSRSRGGNSGSAVRKRPRRSTTATVAPEGTGSPTRPLT